MRQRTLSGGQLSPFQRHSRQKRYPVEVLMLDRAGDMQEKQSDKEVSSECMIANEFIMQSVLSGETARVIPDPLHGAHCWQWCQPPDPDYFNTRKGNSTALSRLLMLRKISGGPGRGMRRNRNYPPPDLSGQAETARRMVRKGFAPVNRAVSTVVRKSASASAAHLAR